MCQTSMLDKREPRIYITSIGKGSLIKLLLEPVLLSVLSSKIRQVFLRDQLGG